jgi:transposase
VGQHVPRHDDSAGKRRSVDTRKGSKWLSQTLVECAKTANRSKNTYLAAQDARLRARRGANKATIAVCHSILTAIWHMLQSGETYTDPGGDFVARRDPERTRKRLVTQLERLGYTVTLQEDAAAA